VTLVGRKLGPYSVLAHVGHGSTCDVYRAVHSELNKEVALKVLSSSHEGDPEAVERFHREGQTLAQFRHPGIVEVFDCDRIDGFFFLSMTFVPHPTLATVLQEREKSSGGRLPRDRYLSIALSILDALSVIHEAGVVHRDLKPSNVFVLPGDRVLLSDFGLVKLDGADRKLTRVGSVLGTVEYMAPEQITGDAVDSRADLYSVGLVLYVMSCGRLPFGSLDAEIVQKKIIQPSLPPPSDFYPDVDPEMDSVLVKACQRTPSQRFQSAREFASRIKGVLKATSPSVSAISAQDANRRRRRHEAERPRGWLTRRMVRLLLCLATIVGLFSCTVVYLVRRTVTPRTEKPPLDATLFESRCNRALMQAKELMDQSCVWSPSEDINVDMVEMCHKKIDARSGQSRASLSGLIDEMDRAYPGIEAVPTDLLVLVSRVALHAFLVSGKGGASSRRIAQCRQGRESLLGPNATETLMGLASTGAPLSVTKEETKFLSRFFDASRMVLGRLKNRSHHGRTILVPLDDLRFLAWTLGRYAWEAETDRSVRARFRAFLANLEPLPEPLASTLSRSVSASWRFGEQSGAGKSIRTEVRDVTESVAELRSLVPEARDSATRLIDLCWSEFDRQSTRRP